MGAIEESGKAVGSFIDVMKSQPLSLALVVMNFSLVGFVYVQSTQFTTQRRENVALFVQVQTDVQKLLSQCIIPPPQQRGDLMLPLIPPDPVPIPRPRPVVTEPVEEPK